jgi:transposase
VHQGWIRVLHANASASVIKLVEGVDEGEAVEGAGRAVAADRAAAAEEAAPFRYPGRKPLDDRKVLQGILFVLHTGIGWEQLPQELGFGCGMTAWRRLRPWQQAAVWPKLHGLLLAELHGADQLEWEHAVADSSHLQAKKGAPRRVRARSTGVAAAASTTCW